MLLDRSRRDVVRTTGNTGHGVEAAFKQAVRLQMSELDLQLAAEDFVEAEYQLVVDALRSGQSLEVRVGEQVTILGIGAAV